MKKEKKKALFIFHGIIAIIEIVTIMHDSVKAFFSNAFMVLFCTCYILFSFVKKKDDKWWNFSFLPLYIVLTIISYICISM